MNKPNKGFKNGNDKDPEKTMIEIPESFMHHSMYDMALSATLSITAMGYLRGTADWPVLHPKSYPELLIMLCQKGKGFVEINGEQQLVLPGQFFIILPNQKHIYEADSIDPSTLYYIKVKGRRLTAFCKQHAIKRCNKPVFAKYIDEVHNLVSQLIRTLKISCTEDRVLYANLSLQRALAVLFFGVDEDKEDRLNLSSRVVTHMKQNISAKYTLGELAKEFKYSESQFSYLFRREMGKSPIDYFTNLKIEHAKMLLYNSDAKISRVASTVGYDDPYHFSRVFKSVTKVSPVQYRRMTR